VCRFNGHIFKLTYHYFARFRSQSALKALGYALHNRMLSARVTGKRSDPPSSDIFFSSSYLHTEEQSTEIIELICGIITTTKNKSTCNLAVWCISVQNLHPSVLSADEVLHALLSALRHAIEGLGATDSSSVRHEGISAIARLILQCSQAIFDEQNVSLWLPLLLLHMLDPVVKVRDKATSSVAMCMVQLSKLSKTVPEHISQCVFDALADKLLRAINDKMESNDDLIVVRTWGQIVGLLGRFILKSDLINTLLKIPSVSRLI
jgi:telomere-associated protein RIF1